MNLGDILTINSIPFLENELKLVQEQIFNTKSDKDTISLIQREMMIRVRIKQIETILQS